MKTNFHTCILKAIMVMFNLVFIPGILFADDLYISPGGNDRNPGTSEKPLATPAFALEKAKQKFRRDGVKKITLWFDKGVYHLDKTLDLSELKALDGEMELTFRAAGQNPVVFSGGKKLTGWKKVQSGLWEVVVPKEFGPVSKIQELFVDGQRAIRARYPDSGYLRIRKAGEDRRTFFYFNPGDFPVPEKPCDTELILLHDWSISRIGVKQIDTGKNTLTAVDTIGARQPEFFNLDHWEPNPRYYLENAPEFLNVDFEWINLPEESLIRIKLPVQYDPEKMNITIPLNGELVRIQGNGEKPVRNIAFKGIKFQYCAWQVPEQGYCGVQACHFDPRPDTSGWNVVPAAFYAEWAENITLVNCQFNNLGGSGLWFGPGCRNCSVSGSEFRDISGNGIMIGEGQDRKVNGKPWWSEAPEQVAVKNVIEDCTVTECGSRFSGAVGIWCGLTAETKISGCHVYNLPYTGISIGWMWSPVPTPCRANIIEHCHIHHIMQVLSDGGGIYMLGLQPGSKIISNHIHDVEINAGRAESNGMFLDEGTTDVVISGNLIYNIAKSPLRFHRATTNLVSENQLFCTGDNPPVRYNTTKEEDIKKVNNQIFYEKDQEYSGHLKKAIDNWKTGTK